MEGTSPPHLAMPPRRRRSACWQAHRPLIHDMYRALQVLNSRLLDEKQWSCIWVCNDWFRMIPTRSTTKPVSVDVPWLSLQHPSHSFTRCASPTKIPQEQRSIPAKSHVATLVRKAHGALPRGSHPWVPHASTATSLMWTRLKYWTTLWSISC